MSASLAIYQERIAQVVARIRQAELTSNAERRALGLSPYVPHGAVRLLAVSKTFAASEVAAAAACGLRAFGENYVQEGVDKILQLTAQNISNTLPTLEWHFIGPLQSNKTRPIAEHFDWVHSIDRLKIAERLSQQRTASLPPLQVLLQVNISAEASKSGFSSTEVLAAAHAVRALPHLQLRGLMAIPAPAATLAEQRIPFRAMRALFDKLNQEGFNLDTLSLGMSADLEAAILEGSTMVRVGSAIFGERT